MMPPAAVKKEKKVKKKFKEKKNTSRHQEKKNNKIKKRWCSFPLVICMYLYINEFVPFLQDMQAPGLICI